MNASMLTSKLKYSVILAAVVMAAACGNGSKEGKSLEAKKMQLEQLQNQVKQLEAEISKLDTATKVQNKKLVALTPIATEGFTHYLDLQGKVDAENISYVAPRGNPGVVRAIYVKKGDQVKKGQLLLKLDDALLRQQLANAQTQLAFAKDLYQRRKNLWSQNIGAEVDVITAKNSVDQAESQIKIINEQLGFTNVYADMNGVVDDITVKVGELFQGGPQIRLVNTSELKSVIQVPELYQDRVKVGTPVKIILPEVNNKVIEGRVSVTGKLIDPSTRSFYVEVKLPADRDLRPNQIALAKIQDYSIPKTIVIPVNTLQTDDKGKYVLLAANENGNMVAKKRSITIGQMYGDKIEVKEGLSEGDQLITDGFQGLYDGQLITTNAQ